MEEERTTERDAMQVQDCTQPADEINSIEGVKEQEPVTYRKHGFRYGVYRFVKRTFDIFSSGLLLIIVSPLIILLLLVKWLEDVKCPSYKLEITEVADDGKKHKKLIRRADGKLFRCRLVRDKEKKIKGSKNPVYSSDRVGPNKKDGTRGKIFKFHKIRSMCPGAEQMKQQLIDAGLNEADPPAFKMKNDPRITKVGKFLRKSSLDELLQLWDIFIGKMSVVGPRPPIPSEVDEYTPHQMHRLDTKGGLLCFWQITKDRNLISFEDWVDLDIEYIKRQSLWLDLKIIVKGFFMVIFDHSGE